MKTVKESSKKESKKAITAVKENRVEAANEFLENLNEDQKEILDERSKKAEKTKVSKPYVADEVSATTEETEKIVNVDVKNFSVLGKFSAEKKERKVATKKEKEEKGETLHRQDSVIASIKELCVKGATLKEIMNRANDIHIAAGGESNPTATNVNRYSIAALVAFDILRMDEKGIYTLK